MTVQKQWDNFRSRVYPDTDQSAEQIRQLKAAWFAATFDTITVLKNVIPAMPEEQGVATLMAIEVEAKDFINAYIKEENERQAQGLRP